MFKFVIDNWYSEEVVVLYNGIFVMVYLILVLCDILKWVDEEIDVVVIDEV